MRILEDGSIAFKEKNFFLRYLWGANFYRFLMPKILKLTVVFKGDARDIKDPQYPKNLCSLFWGSVLGAPLCWFFTVVASILLLVAGVVVWCCLIIMLIFIVTVVFPIGFLLGFLPNLSRDRKTKDIDISFNPYRVYSKKNNKRLPLAPWHIWLPVLVIWLLVMKDFLIIKSVAYFFSHSVVLMVLGGIVGLVFLILFFRSTAWRVCWEFAKAKKSKMCPLIVIEK